MMPQRYKNLIRIDKTILKIKNTLTLLLDFHSCIEARTIYNIQLIYVTYLILNKKHEKYFV